MFFGRLALVVLMLLMLFPGPARSQSQEAKSLSLASMVAEFTSHIFDGLLYIQPCEGRRSIGIWPFETERLPISTVAAKRLYGELVRALLKYKPVCVDVLDGTGIGAVLSYLHRTGALREAGGNPVAALEAANQSVDIIILARLIVQQGTVMLTLKAVDKQTGGLLAYSKTHRLPPESTQAALSDVAHSIDAAIDAAIEQFSQQARDMIHLVPGGIYYQDTGAQPAFSRYFHDRIVNRLVSRWSNLITGQALVVIRPQFDLAGSLGRPLSARALDPLGSISQKVRAEGLYQLKGRYWLIGDAVDITLTLTSATGRSASWQGRLRQADIEGLALIPKNRRLTEHGQSFGSFAMQMTSARGANPVLHPGQELQVFIRTDRDAWLYCFYINAAGGVTKVLPNIHQKDFSDGHRLKAHVLHALPDPKRDPFVFRITGKTLGEEMLKCLATSRHVDKELPHVLRRRAFTTLPETLAANLDVIFGKLPNTSVAHAAVTVTIVAKR